MTEFNDFRIGASLLRRIFAAAMFGLLAYVLMKMGFSDDGELWIRAVLVVFAGAVIAMGVWLWQATEGELVLKDGALVVEGGRVLARLDEIDRVERGAFALKPAGGFVLKMKQKQKFGWGPGLWWVRGKTVAIGGVVHPAAGKAMGQIIEAEMAEMALQKSPDEGTPDGR
ncbi:hypothetical protein KUV47_03595 [Vannielia litorea]|uniref:hypothetical protein n=1 Tax=Vannielia TaxID=2813041 RepID=UPI001C9510A0|nr:hypothetical protein [Vannielia litorea]MBY6047777.1 hypothetical protein [Vannielia litorea]MBY6075191.1 hypothetical protein [Vannielia litorea]MBY6152286.1 hypothetical protein [Vannielia litorea]